MNSIDAKINEVKLQILEFLANGSKLDAVRFVRSSLSLDLEMAMKLVKQVEKEVTPDE